MPDIYTSIFLLIIFIGFFIGTVPYLIKTLKGEIQPNKVSWFFWSIPPLVTVVAQYLDGLLTWVSFPVFLVGFGPFLIFLASFVNPKAYWKLEKFDYFLAGIIALFLIIWSITNDIYIAVTFSVIADALASVPTIKKAYLFPKSESVWPFFIGLYENVLALFFMERYDFIEMAFPIYLIVICFIFTWLLRQELFDFIKNYKKKFNKTT